MRKILLLSIFLSFLGCINQNDTNPEGVKYFASMYLNQLDLAHIDNFWSEGIAIDTSYFMGANFENHTGFREGIRLYSGNGKAIWISVFKTKEDAVNAMELRINDVACIINNGNPDEFENQWWYSECIDYILFENQYNTIVEIDFSSNATIRYLVYRTSKPKN
jgi:hypothetical protein